MSYTNNPTTPATPNLNPSKPEDKNKPADHKGATPVAGSDTKKSGDAAKSSI
jgi:hypothetical protein